MRVQNGTSPLCNAVLVAGARRNVRRLSRRQSLRAVDGAGAGGDHPPDPCQNGHSQRTVERLTLNSSDRQELGGGGEAGDKELDWQAASNQILLGFSGRSGSELDSIRAVISTCGPLHWEQQVEAGQEASLRPGPPEKAAGSEGP